MMDDEEQVGGWGGLIILSPDESVDSVMCEWQQSLLHPLDDDVDTSPPAAPVILVTGFVLLSATPESRPDGGEEGEENDDEETV